MTDRDLVDKKLGFIETCVEECDEWSPRPHRR